MDNEKDKATENSQLQNTLNIIVELLQSVDQRLEKLESHVYGKKRALQRSPGGDQMTPSKLPRLDILHIDANTTTDISNVEVVFHLGPPSTMESYIQQIGRAGRSRKQAKAVLYWNNADIGTNITHMSDIMQRYCRSTECLRNQIIRYYGFENVVQSK